MDGYTTAPHADVANTLVTVRATLRSILAKLLPDAMPESQ
jgi:hypothetical protein